MATEEKKRKKKTLFKSDKYGAPLTPGNELGTARSGLAGLDLSRQFSEMKLRPQNNRADSPDFTQITPEAQRQFVDNRLFASPTLFQPVEFTEKMKAIPTVDLTKGDFYPEIKSPDLFARIQQVEADPNYPREKSFWKRVGSGLLQALSTVGANPNASPLSLLGALASGAVMSGFSPKVEAENRRKQELANLWAQYQRQLAVDKQNQELFAKRHERQLKQDRFDQMVWRDQTRAEQADERLEQSERRLEQNEERIRQQALRNIANMKFFDPENPSHQELARAAGLDPSAMKRVDLRNPYLKEVDGIIYRYDSLKGAFVPTNLPANQAKRAVPYTLIDQSGRRMTFYVPSERAASMAQSMAMFGQRLQFQRQVEQNREEWRMRQEELQKQRLGTQQQSLELQRQRFEFEKQRKQLQNNYNQTTYRNLLKELESAILQQDMNRAAEIRNRIKQAVTNAMSAGYSEAELKALFPGYEQFVEIQ